MFWAGGLSARTSINEGERMQPVYTVLIWLAAAAGTLLVGLELKWVDRKVTARVQYRVGPPWYQPVADVLKLMGKESMMPASARGTAFLLAPVLALSATAVAAAVLWMAAFAPGRSLVGDLIVVVYLLMIPALMTILGASASGNPHATVGAAREMKLLLSYELPLLLALLVAVIKAGWTFGLGEIVQAQQASSPTLLSVSGLLALAVAVVCTQAKLGQIPFDVAEAECEIMSGVYVEYSGPALAMFLLSRAMLLVLLPLLVVLVFWGGLFAGAWWGAVSFIGKMLLLVVLVILIRNTNPRLRIDQTVRFFWGGLTPLAILAVVLAVLGGKWGVAWL